MRIGNTGELNLPPRLVDWNSDHMVIALSRRGEDCMGNLILGHESLTRYFEASPKQIIDLSERTVEYPKLAERAIEGDPAGSWAGGEQPKFTAILNDGDIRQVLVQTPAALEWASALDAAARFWDRAARDCRISEEFRRTCGGNIETVQPKNGC